MSYCIEVWSNNEISTETGPDDSGNHEHEYDFYRTSLNFIEKKDLVEKIMKDHSYDKFGRFQLTKELTETIQEIFAIEPEMLIYVKLIKPLFK